jgi:hypothetical protein
MRGGVDIHIITCTITSKRLENLLQSLQPLLNADIVDTIRLICKYDIQYTQGDFAESLWLKHVRDIYPILARNAAETIIRNDNINGKQGLLRHLISQEAETLFPSRQLRPSEMSLLCKHYESLRVASKPVLTLEDDAELDPEHFQYLRELLDNVDALGFVDLGYYPGLQARGRYIPINNNHGVYSTRVALTRTTLATIMSYDTIKKLRNIYWPCALPADLHFQRLLYSATIKGCWSESKVFRSLSTEGVVHSSIQ